MTAEEFYKTGTFVEQRTWSENRFKFAEAYLQHRANAIGDEDIKNAKEIQHTFGKRSLGEALYYVINTRLLKQ